MLPHNLKSVQLLLLCPLLLLLVELQSNLSYSAQIGRAGVSMGIGALLYVGSAFNNKVLVALSAIGAQQAAATKNTAAAIEQLLDYVATYPNDGILFRKAI